MLETERFKKGMAVRRKVLGDAYVDGAKKRTTALAQKLTQPFQELVTESVWGHIWSRPGLDHRTRNLINVALMVSMNRPNELRLYIEARKNTGATIEEIAEVILQTAVYCGAPAALEAFKELERVLAEEEQENIRA
jgi:4-carboxymuconolactone decarboxylase